MKFGEFCNFMVAMATGQFIMIKKCRILTKYVIFYEHTHFQKNLRQGHICHLVNLALCCNATNMDLASDKGVYHL